MELNKATLDAIQKDMNEALETVRAKHGLTSLKTGKCKYDPTNGFFTYDVEGITSDGIDRAGALYKSLQVMLDLPELGATFDNAGQTHTITGCNTTGSKIFTKVAGDKKNATYQWKVEAIERIFTRKKLIEAAKPSATTPL